MSNIKKYFWWYFLALVLITIISGLPFHNYVAGNSNTNIFSVLFGWQWLYLATASICLLLVAIIKKNKAFIRAALIILASLVIVFIPAHLIYSSRFYITGDGGPAGPHMACLVWDKSKISGAYGYYNPGGLGLCTLMSIPSLNKFLIDRRPRADSTDASATYYLMLVVNESIIIGGLIRAKRQILK